MEPSMLASVDKDCFLSVEKDESVAPANDSLESFLVTQSVRVILWLKVERNLITIGLLRKSTISEYFSPLG